MGLVIQPPVDALLPRTDSPGHASPNTDAADGSQDAFAGLLASLSESPDSDEKESASEVSAVPAEDAGAEDKKKPAADPFAALLALTVPLAAPVVVPPVVVAVADASSAATPIDGSTTVASPATPETAGESLEVAAPAAEVAAPQPPGQQAEAIAPAAVNGAIPPESSGAAPAAVTPEAIAAAATAPTEAADPTVALEANPSPRPGEPPTEANGRQPEQSANAASVVRTVGNAQTETEAGEGDASSGDDKPGTAERPQPRGSAQALAQLTPNPATGDMPPAADVGPADAAIGPDAPAPAPELPKQVEHVASAVIERVDAGGGEARIHLDPVDLGEVTIHVHTEGQSVRVEIHAERREAMNLLRDHSQDLSALLGDRGLNLSDVNVGLGRGNGGQAWGNEDQQPQNRPVSGEFASVLGIEDGASMERHQRLRAAYNPDGAHLFRV